MTSIDVERILDLMDQGHINREVLLPQDHARESFRLPSITARNYQEFEYLITSYMQHHYQKTGEGERSRASCFGEAKHILDQAFNKDPYQDGYNQAMQMGIDGSQGGMRMVLNEVTEVLKRRALQNHMDHIFHHHFVHDHRHRLRCGKIEIDIAERYLATDKQLLGAPFQVEFPISSWSKRGFKPGAGPIGLMAVAVVKHVAGSVRAVRGLLPRWFPPAEPPSADQSHVRKTPGSRPSPLHQPA